MRVNIWACGAGDPKTDGTLFNLVVTTDDIRSFIYERLRGMGCTNKTVVARVEDFGTSPITTVLVLERVEKTMFTFDGHQRELTDENLQDLVSNHRIEIGIDDPVVWNLGLNDDIRLLKAALLNGCVICGVVFSNPHQILVERSAEYVVTLQF